jgi:hypothetical protein
MVHPVSLHVLVIQRQLLVQVCRRLLILALVWCHHLHVLANYHQLVVLVMCYHRVHALVKCRHLVVRHHLLRVLVNYRLILACYRVLILLLQALQQCHREGQLTWHLFHSAVHRHALHLLHQQHFARHHRECFHDLS